MINARLNGSRCSPNSTNELELKNLKQKGLFFWIFYISPRVFLRIHRNPPQVSSKYSLSVPRLKHFSLITGYFRRNVTRRSIQSKARLSLTLEHSCTYIPRLARQIRGFTVPRFSKLSRHLSRARW